MRKRSPADTVSNELRSYFLNAALSTDYGRRLKEFMRRDGESDKAYGTRVNLFREERLIDEHRAQSEKDDLLQRMREHHEPTSHARLPGEELAWKAIQEFVDELLSLRGPFMQAARQGKAETLRAMLARGFPVNYQDPETGDTALHLVAAHQARKALRVLLATGECNFLLRDGQGRLSSEVAYLDGRDPAVSRLLGIKEKKQGAAEGVTLGRRPSPTQ